MSLTGRQAPWSNCGMTFSLPRPEHKVELTRGRLPADQVYPTNDRYQFQEFPLVVIELGGYQDATIINPYSGERLWVSDACAASGPEVCRVCGHSRDDHPKGRWGGGQSAHAYDPHQPHQEASTAAILRRLADALDEYNASAEPASQQ